GPRLVPACASRGLESEDSMTTYPHLPSRRVLLAAGALALAVVVALYYWHTIVAVVLAAVGVRAWLVHRARNGASRASRPEGGLPRWLDAGALLLGVRSFRRGLA